ncbi:hypothetical protein HA38_02645 [Pantoea allii]|nr:hypothetical protein A6A26_05170 [Pantoea sp. OXWO6B1]ORM88732.1 hypothetical protein HA38_02645 [Pantoea allii]PBK00390.1 hypothetical protein CMR03_10205 [Pantoea allii]
MKNPCLKPLLACLQVLCDKTGADFDRLIDKSKFYDRFRQIFALSFCKAIVRLTLTGYHRTLLFTPDP